MAEPLGDGWAPSIAVIDGKPMSGVESLVATSVK